MSNLKPENDVVPTFRAMLWPTLLALKSLGNSAGVRELTDRASELAGFSDVQLEVLHNDGPRTRVQYRMAWARSYLKEVGAAENSRRGVWSITEYGQSLTEADMLAIPSRARVLAIRRREGSTESASPQAAPLGDSELALEPDLEDSQAATDWQTRLLDVLQAMDPAAFERLCQRILRESGFTKVEVTGRSGDGGIDGVGVLRIALLSFQVFFQCKRYRGSVGASAIRDFRGAMVGRTDKGLLITTGSFTPEAKREATRDGAPVLDLIDGDALCDLLKVNGLGVTTRTVEAVEINAGWFSEL